MFIRQTILVSNDSSLALVYCLNRAKVCTRVKHAFSSECRKNRQALGQKTGAEIFCLGKMTCSGYSSAFMSDSKFIVKNTKRPASAYEQRPQGRTEKGELHPRNRHVGQYDFNQLQKSYPALKSFMTANYNGQPSIDFANPEAVKALNAALLKEFYQVEEWNIPEGYLCPPIPGRADYIQHIADILSVSRGMQVPQGEEIKILDIGTGANCIYPIIGHQQYGWKFVGTDIDPVALESAQKIIDANPALAAGVELRQQRDSDQIFQGVIGRGEKFDLSMCNPPFHASAEEADYINRVKWRNLGKAAVANFGGQNAELWCEGGEMAFVKKMIAESQAIPHHIQWFTCYISKEFHMEEIYATLKEADVMEYRTIHMSQGQKKSRFVAWTYIGGKTPFHSF